MNSSCGAILSLALATATFAGTGPERTISTSRQFIVYGTDLQLRGAISQLAEETKTNLLHLLQRSDTWQTPIVLNLQFPQANLSEVPPAALHFSQTGAGLKVQLDLMISQVFNRTVIEREILRAVVLEMIYRKEPQVAPGTAYVEPPEWLLDGILAGAVSHDLQPDLDVLAPIVGANKIARLSDFLNQRPAVLDSPGRALFRAYSVVFVKWIVDLSEGRSRLAHYIDNLHRASSDPLTDLRAYFSELTDDALEKIWPMRVAQFAASQDFHLLGFSETEQRLRELLLMKIKDGKETRSLENYLPGRLSKVEAQNLTRLSGELMMLGTRAHPVLRPLINDYQQTAALLSVGKSSGTKERLARLRALRARLTARMDKIDDYMNWYEATQSRTASGAFADYLNAVEENSGAPRRHDPISVYLDAMEEQFQN